MCFEDVFVCVAFDIAVVEFEESGLETAGAVGEAVSAFESLVDECLAFLEIAGVVDAETDWVHERFWVWGWLGW